MKKLIRASYTGFDAEEQKLLDTVAKLKKQGYNVEDSVNPAGEAAIAFYDDNGKVISVLKLDDVIERMDESDDGGTYEIIWQKTGLRWKIIRDDYGLGISDDYYVMRPVIYEDGRVAYDNPLAVPGYIKNKLEGLVRQGVIKYHDRDSVTSSYTEIVGSNQKSVKAATELTIQDKIADLSAAYKKFEDKGFKKVYGFSERNEYYCRYYAKLNKDQTVDMACVSLYTDNADQVKLDVMTGNNLDLEGVEEFVIDQGDSKDFFDNAIKPYLPVKDDRDEETIFNENYQKSVEGLMGDYYSLKDLSSIDYPTQDRLKRAYKKYRDMKHEGEVNHAQILNQISVKPYVIKWLKAVLTQD